MPVPLAIVRFEAEPAVSHTTGDARAVSRVVLGLGVDGHEGRVALRAVGLRVVVRRRVVADKVLASEDSGTPSCPASSRARLRCRGPACIVCAPRFVVVAAAITIMRGAVEFPTGTRVVAREVLRPVVVERGGRAGPLRAARAARVLAVVARTRRPWRVAVRAGGRLAPVHRGAAVIGPGGAVVRAAAVLPHPVLVLVLVPSPSSGPHSCGSAPTLESRVMR